MAFKNDCSNGELRNRGEPLVRLTCARICAAFRTDGTSSAPLICGIALPVREEAYPGEEMTLRLAMWRGDRDDLRHVIPEISLAAAWFLLPGTGAAELRRRTSKFSLEYAVERRFRCIADFGRDLSDVRV
jgi:hypothetical protein